MLKTTKKNKFQIALSVHFMFYYSTITRFQDMCEHFENYIVGFCAMQLEYETLWNLEILNNFVDFHYFQITL